MGSKKLPFNFLKIITYTVAVDGQGCFKLNELTDKFFAIHFALKPSLSYLFSYNSHSENNHFQASKMKKFATMIQVNQKIVLFFHYFLRILTAGAFAFSSNL